MKTVRPVLLALTFFVLGIAVTAFWHSRTAGRSPMNVGREADGPLSDRTKDVLKPLTTHPTAASPPDPAVAAEVRQAIPNLTAVSVEEGKRILTGAALKDFQAAANEMKARVTQAEERFVQAQNGGSEAERQAAREQLQRVRADQAEKLNQIAERLEARIAALERLKAK